jgi:hypothetical protein
MSLLWSEDPWREELWSEELWREEPLRVKNSLISARA